MQAVGDMARALVLRTNQVRLRAEMDDLAVEVSTGLVRDAASHLGGDVSGLLAIDRSLERISAFQLNVSEAKLMTGAVQTTLDEIQTRTETLSQSLISAELSPSPALLTSMSRDAEDALGQTLGSLNRTVAGRFMFSGTATDRAALQDLDTMLTQVRAAVVGQTDFAGVDAALDTFFGAGGTFETTIYQGSATGLAPLRLSETETATFDIRADDQVFREFLKPLAMAAIAMDDTLTVDDRSRIEMLTNSGSAILNAQSSMVELRAGLGALEARVEDASTRISAEKTATTIAKLELVGTDQYETAARYEAIRGQLESLYAITARSQRLSLAEYL